MGRWKQLASKTVYTNPWFSVRDDAVVKPDGSTGTYSVVDTLAPAVFIIAMTPQQEIYLIKQFRYPTQRTGWELPNGNSEGEEAILAARRELAEETGLGAEEWEIIGEFDSMNGLSSERCYVVVARSLNELGENKQAEEGIVQSEAFSIETALQMATDGEIRDGQSLAALLLLVEHLKQNQPVKK
jgi:8-oxo-dGTP pyrophosphatase MutT (NUDIX family)